MKILIVRLGALGDIVHAVPAAAALRRALPTAQIDWLVDERHREMVDLVHGVDTRIAVDPSGKWRELRRDRAAAARDALRRGAGLPGAAEIGRSRRGCRGRCAWRVFTGMRCGSARLPVLYRDAIRRGDARAAST